MFRNLFFKSSARFFVIGLSVVVVSQGISRAEDEVVVPAVEDVAQNQGGQIEKLTEDLIKDFYKQAETASLTGGKVALEFLDRHTAEEAKTKLHMRTTVPNKPPVKNIVTSDKATMLSETKDAYERGSVDSMKTEVISVEIADDGKSASVMEKTISDYSLTLSEKQKVNVSTEQSCDTEIILNEGVIQTGASECDVEVNVVPVK